MIISKERNTTSLIYSNINSLRDPLEYCVITVQHQHPTRGRMELQSSEDLYVDEYSALLAERPLFATLD